MRRRAKKIARSRTRAKPRQRLKRKPTKTEAAAIRYVTCQVVAGLAKHNILARIGWLEQHVRQLLRNTSADVMRARLSELDRVEREQKTRLDG